MSDAHAYTSSFRMVISAGKKVKRGDGWRAGRRGCLRWGVREPFSEEAAFEQRPRGSEGAATELCAGREFQAERAASAKAL